MQKFRTLEDFYPAALHPFIQLPTTHSSLVVLVQLLARVAWGNKKAQGTSAHLNHPSKRVYLGAKPATQAALLVRFRGCTEERSYESPKEMLARLIWTNWTEISHSTQKLAGTCVQAHVHRGNECKGNKPRKTFSTQLLIRCSGHLAKSLLKGGISAVEGLRQVRVFLQFTQVPYLDFSRSILPE